MEWLRCFVEMKSRFPLLWETLYAPFWNDDRDALETNSENQQRRGRLYAVTFESEIPCDLVCFEEFRAEFGKVLFADAGSSQKIRRQTHTGGEPAAMFS